MLKKGGKKVGAHVGGFDISTKTGVVVLSADGRLVDAREIQLVEVPKGSGPGPRVERAYELARLTKIMTRLYTFSLIVVESYTTSGRFVNYVQNELGAFVRHMLWEQGIPFVELSPSSLKKFATEGGKADKSQMRLAVFKRWGFESPSDNIVDAFALARLGLCAAGHVKMNAYEREVVGKLKRSQPGIPGL